MRKYRMVIMAVLCAVLITAGFPVNAKTSARIADVEDTYWSETSLADVAVLSYGYVADLQDLFVRPGELLQIMLPPEAFVDSEGNVLAGDALSSSQLAEGKVSVRYKATAGAQALAGVTVGYDAEIGACVLVQFQPELVKTQETTFEYDIYLTVRGRRRANTTFTIAGKIANPVVYVYGHEEVVNLSGGTVAEATTYIRDIRLDLGNGLSVNNSLYEGSRYYGVAAVEQSADDTPLLPDYPEVELIYTLSTIGLKREDRDIVTFDFTERYYVYNQDGKYIGTTNKLLPYSAKYYLALTQIGSIEVKDSLS
jgi:hypothetical protein